MARKGGNNKGTSKGRGQPRSSKRAPVGSSPRAAEEFAEKNDFGIPAEQARDRAVAGQDLTQRRNHQRTAHGGQSGLRESGVGREDSGPGSSSGGDLDTTYTSVTGGGLAEDAPDRITIGPASTTGSSDEFASGGRAKGEGNLKPGTHGTLKRSKGTFHSAGGDVRSINDRTGSPSAARSKGAGENRREPPRAEGRPKRAANRTKRR